MIQRKEGQAAIFCDGCHEVIGACGTMCQSDDGKEELHFCDACSSPANQEFRVCMHCGLPMVDGMTNLETVYTHEECFEAWMDENCPGGWREVEDDGCDGYYEEKLDGEWVGTGIFYTTWY